MRQGVIAAIAVVAVVGVAALVVLGAGSGDRAGTTPAPTGPPPVLPAQSVAAEARVVPERRAEISATTPGLVEAVLVAEGDRVSAGQEVLRFDTRAASAALKRAQAGLDAAAARVAQATAAADRAAAETDRATAVLRSARATRDQLPSSAKKAQKRAADANSDAAAAGVASARAAVREARAAVTTAEADKAAADAGIASAQAAIDALTITAPIGGTVASVGVRAGEVAPAGAVLVRIGDGSWVIETTDLGQEGVAGIDVGATATITLDGFPDPVAGTVSRIAPYGVDRQGDVAFAVAITPDTPLPDGARWNMSASVDIATSP
jgi:multidrug resistance efflux pump